jgi:hypothetical protein
MEDPVGHFGPRLGWRVPSHACTPIIATTAIVESILIFIFLRYPWKEGRSVLLLCREMAQIVNAKVLRMTLVSSQRLTRRYSEAIWLEAIN